MESTYSLGYMLGQTLKVFKNQMISEFKAQKIELSIEQFIFLHILNSNCDLIQQDLANHLQKDKPIIVRQISVLLKEQYVIRIINKDDKRKKNLILTKKGFDILVQMKQVEPEVSKKLLSGISESGFEAFQNVLIKIQKNGGAEDEFFNC